MFFRRYLGAGRWELKSVSYIIVRFYSLWVLFPEAPDAVQGGVSILMFSQKRLMLYKEEFQFWCLRTLMTAKDMSVINCSKKD